MTSMTLASLYTNTFDMLVIDFIECVEGGVWGPPQKNLGLNGVKLCNSRSKKHGIAL